MKATQTNFTYTFDGKLCHGSYLGRKPASRETIVRFLRRNAKTARTDPSRQKLVKIGSSFLTRWEI